MEAHIQHLHALIEKHVAETGSVWGEEILRDFRTYLANFWVVKPKAASIEDLIEHLRSAA
jgi:glutamate synthase (NADPH/NADH) large chain